jgi:hypothetical protein
MGRLAFLVLVFATVVASRHGHAQEWACTTIQPGETASSVAARITGSAGNRHESWFQIVEPVTGRTVAKSRYDRIYEGWRACVVQQTVIARQSDAAMRVPVAAAAESPWSRVTNALRAIDEPLVLWGALTVALAFLWNVCSEYYRERERTLILMRHYGERFVREFERPLLQPPLVKAPIRARLRTSPGSGRLDVCLAPNAGRRYPNLSDHRDNVFYDIARISQALRDPSFVCFAPYAKAGWVVIPIQFQAGAGQAGGP